MYQDIYLEMDSSKLDHFSPIPKCIIIAPEENDNKILLLTQYESYQVQLFKLIKCYQQKCVLL